MNGLQIAYEAFGNASDPPLVLVMGLGAQMVAWPDDFCADLARAGHYVIRFDNRDVGLSTHLDQLPVPSAMDIVARRRPPYRMSDMADDVVGLLDALHLGSVHLVGASLGGQVAQTVALEHRGRLRSLTLLMTSTGSLRAGRPKPQLLPMLLHPPKPKTRSEAVEATVKTFRRIGSPGYPLDEAHLRSMAERGWDRGHNPAGWRRQLAAAVSQPDRTGRLSSLALPMLVVHGLHDPLVHFSGGLAIARAVPGSSFLGVSGMGHDLPRAVRPMIVEQIVTLTSRR